LYAIQTFGLTKEFNQVKSYKDLLLHPFRKRRIIAVCDVNLKVRRQEIVGLLGPNGAGKTTLLKLLSTLVLPTRGTALINGYDLLKDAKRIKSEVGIVISEERSFYWRLTGRQNLEFFASLYNLTKDQARRRIEEVLELLDLKDAADTMFMRYSTGMKQKLSIARGLLSDPAILLLDEPTKSLDPIAAQNLRRFIREEIVQRQGRTVVFATHQLQEAEELCDRIAIIDKGRIKAFGTLEKIRRSLGLKERYTFVVENIPVYALEKISKVGKIIEQLDVTDDGRYRATQFKVLVHRGQDDVDRIIRIVLSSNGRIRACYPEKVPLDEIVCDLVERDPLSI